MDLSSYFELSYWDYVGIFIILLITLYYLFAPKAPEIKYEPKPQLERMPKQDMTLEELRQYDGVESKRILMAINGRIFDISRGSDFYGPGGPYEKLAGHDATRALAKMDAKMVKEEKDDISDLTPSEKDEAKEWEMTISSKYPTVGKLVDREEDKSDYSGALSEITLSGY